MAALRVDERAHFGLPFALPLSVATAWVAVVGGDGRIGRQFFEFLDGWLRHGFSGSGSGCAPGSPGSLPASSPSLPLSHRFSLHLGTSRIGRLELPPEDWWRSDDLEWQAPELPLDDGQVLVLDAEDPFPADEWPVYRAD